MPIPGVDAARMIDTLDDHESVAAGQEIRGGRSRRPVEQGDDRLRRAETGDEPAHVLAADVHVDAGSDQALRVGRDPFPVGQPDERPAAGVQRTRHDEVALRQEQPGASVVALVAPVGKPPFVEPELRQSLIMGVIDQHEHGAQ